MMNPRTALAAYIDLPTYLGVSNHGNWKRAEHLDILCKALHDVDSGKITRLIVNMPPRHGKSEVISKGFPSWYLGRHPDREVMLISYGSELAEDFSRINREKLREFGPEIFGIHISKESAAVGRWGIDGHKGGLVAAGVNGPLTGRGANIAIIDDPIKGSLEANSATYKQHLLEWYQTVLRTRMAPGGAIIVVQTRWAKDDLAGWLIEQGETGGETWTVLNMPAISGDEPDSLNRPPNQALWPVRFPLSYLEITKATLTPYQWSALYQQQPIDYEGALWNYSDIDANRLSETDHDRIFPQFRSIVVGVDPSGTSDPKRSDEAGIIVVAAGMDGHYYVLEDRSGVRSPLETARETVAAYWLFSCDYIVVETNFGGQMMRDLIRTVDKRPLIVEVNASRGKRIRAQPISALYGQGLVHHVGRFQDLEKQLCSWNQQSTSSPDRMDALVWAITNLSDETDICVPLSVTTGGRL